MAIIGVVAALTIPTLTKNYQNHELEVALKKQGSILSEAYLKLVADDVDISSLFPLEAPHGVIALNAFATKLKILKNCGWSTGCWYTTPIGYLNGNTYTANASSYFMSTAGGSAILIDGSIIYVYSFINNCTNSGDVPDICGFIRTDVNGTKGPNKLGRDIFDFHITKKGIYPYGANRSPLDCDPTDLRTNGLSTGRGFFCASYIMLKGMDY